MKRYAGMRAFTVLAACLFCLTGCVCGALAEEAGPATYAELMRWRDEIWARTRNQPVQNNPPDTYDPTGRATYLIQQGSYTIESSSPTLNVEDNPIVSVTFNDVHAEGPRGTGLGMAASDILAVYQNDNPALLGDEEFAALYVYDIRQRIDHPEAAWGLAMRDFRGLLNLEYAVSAPYAEADAYTNIVISYVVTDGYVTDMRVAGFADSLLPEELRESIDTVRGIAAKTSFDPETGIQPPLHAEMFGREDLYFFGLDFLAETEQSARERFGAPVSETVIPAEDGGPAMLLLTYAGFKLEFDQPDGLQPALLRSLLISDPEATGPRGVRVGDTLSDVLFRFRMEDYSYQEPTTILYAPGESAEQPPFGLLETYSGRDATVRYAMPVPPDGTGGAIMLLITLEDMRVTELYMYRWHVE